MFKNVLSLIEDLKILRFREIFKYITSKSKNHQSFETSLNNNMILI